MKKKILQAVARGWCSKRNKHKVMDVDLAEDITAEVEKLINRVNKEEAN